jgi:cobalt/nickel transport system ATP-binding protein
VSHDLEMVQALCSRVIVMDEGSVVAIGAQQVILEDKSLLAAHRLVAPIGHVISKQDAL